MAHVSVLFAGTALQVPLRTHFHEEPIQLYPSCCKGTSRGLGVDFAYREFPVIAFKYGYSFEQCPIGFSFARLSL